MNVRFGVHRLDRFSILLVLFSLVPATSVRAEQQALSPDTKRYVESRFGEAQRELKALQKLIVNRRRNGGAARLNGVRAYDELTVLSWTQEQLQEELQILGELDQRRRGKGGFGDPRATLGEYSRQGIGLSGTTDYYRDQLREAEAAVRMLRQLNRAPDASVMQRAVDAYPSLFTAIGHRLATTDHALIALGAPSVATLSESHRQALQAHEEAVRLRQARQEYEGRQAVQAIAQAAAGVAQSFIRALHEQSNNSFDDLGEGGELARRSSSFNPIGLSQGEFLARIYSGRQSQAPGDLRTRLALDAWVVKYSGMCRRFLPPNREEIVNIAVDTLTTKNLLGVVLSEETTVGAPQSTGVFAAPEFARAHVRWSGLDLLRTLESWADGPAAAIDAATAMRVDVRHLIARHGCEGAIPQQFANNLLRLVQ